jgi:hypothetical protein
MEILEKKKKKEKQTFFRMCLTFFRCVEFWWGLV